MAFATMQIGFRNLTAIEEVMVFYALQYFYRIKFPQ